MGCAGSRDATASADPNANLTDPNAATQPQSVGVSGFASTFVKQAGAFLNPSVVLTTLRPATEEIKKQGHHLRNIFAKPLQDLLPIGDSFKPPVHTKTDEEKAFLHEALKHNFVFETMSKRELKPLVDAFEEWSVAAKEVIITQGDTKGDYFYIIKKGSVQFLIDDKPVGTAGPGDSFGELALLFTCPRAATVQAVDKSVTLYRVDQLTFRYILKEQTEKGEADKAKLLEGVEFLKDLSEEQREKLSRAMKPKRFTAGEYLMKKGDKADYFYILKEGQVKATDISAGNTKYEDVTLSAGQYFGERALVLNELRLANVVAVTDGLAFDIDKDTFETVLGKYNDLILKSQDLKQLSVIKVLADSHLESHTLSSLSRLIKDRELPKGTKLTQEGKPGLAALYLVRKGKIEVASSSSREKKIVERGGFFGDDLLLADQNASQQKDPTKIVAPYTATVVEDCTVGVLTLSSCRRVYDTRYFGKTPPPAVVPVDPKKLKRHRILGAGTFGQVWLVSPMDDTSKQHAYALKIQSKYELCEDGQAKAVVTEKNIMAKLNHPFLISLVASYQDEAYVYMVMELIQGGELYNVIHTPTRDGLPDHEACFYAAGVAEGLGYMHRRGYVYRDLKPENVLLNKNGYCVIIDFGFVKYITFKTYTLCGTPLYMAPEVILNRGHSWGVDHWSLGVMIYEMITGEQPFYERGMQQMDLFKAIVKADVKFPRNVSAGATSIIKGFLTPNPSQRLGSLAGGEDDIVIQNWFSKIDFDKLRSQEIKPPMVPKIKNPLDSSNFDDWSHLEDKTKKKYPPLTAQQKAIFAEF